MLFHTLGIEQGWRACQRCFTCSGQCSAQGQGVEAFTGAQLSFCGDQECWAHHGSASGWWTSSAIGTRARQAITPRHTRTSDNEDLLLDMDSNDHHHKSPVMYALAQMGRPRAAVGRGTSIRKAGTLLHMHTDKPVLGGLLCSQGPRVCTVILFVQVNHRNSDQHVLTFGGMQACALPKDSTIALALAMSATCMFH